MKKMTCKQLGGACDLEFQASTFEEIASLSKQHGAEMWKMGDPQHIEAMQQMQALMQSPEMMKKWMDSKKDEFDQLADI